MNTYLVTFAQTYKVVADDEDEAEAVAQEYHDLGRAPVQVWNSDPNCFYETLSIEKIRA